MALPAIAVKPDERGRYVIRCQCGRAHAYALPGVKRPSCGRRFGILPIPDRDAKGAPS